MTASVLVGWANCSRVFGRWAGGSEPSASFLLRSVQLSSLAFPGNGYSLSFVGPAKDLWW